MSMPIAPRPSTTGDEKAPPSSPGLQKSRKISTACGACKQRKTRCTGGMPCEACAARNSFCDYDATSDQRRKIANQRNVQDLAHAQQALERSRQLLGGIISIIRAGSHDTVNDLVHLIRQPTDLSTMAAHVRNEVRANPYLEEAFHQIDFHIDGHTDLPSPAQLLSRMDGPASIETPDGSSGRTSGLSTDPSLSR